MAGGRAHVRLSRLTREWSRRGAEWVAPASSSAHLDVAGRHGAQDTANILVAAPALCRDRKSGNGEQEAGRQIRSVVPAFAVVDDAPPDFSPHQRLVGGISANDLVDHPADPSGVAGDARASDRTVNEEIGSAKVILILAAGRAVRAADG